MNETAATELAKWLDGDRSQRLEGDVHETVLIIRPDLAPLPRVSIEEILSATETGPFVSTEREAEFEEDQRFVEAVFSTYESEPSLSIDDILAAVELGPLVEEELDDQNVVSLRPWWKNPGVGVIAAAAMALVILIPSQFMAPEYTESAVPVREMASDIEEMEEGPPRAEEREISEMVGKISEKPKSSAQKSSKKKKSRPHSSESNAPPAPMVSPAPEEKVLPEQRSIERANDDVAVESSVLTKESAELQEAIETVEYEELSSSAMNEAPSILKDEEVVLLESKKTMGSFKRNQADKSNRIEKSESIADDVLPESDRDIKDTESLRQSASWFGSLPALLSSEQKAAIASADLASIMDLCSTVEDTIALDILWYASQYSNSKEAIQRLLQSDDFATGDSRYRARNYIRLGDLYAQQGNIVTSEEFYQKSIELQ